MGTYIKLGNYQDDKVFFKLKVLNFIGQWNFNYVDELQNFTCDNSGPFTSGTFTASQLKGKVFDWLFTAFNDKDKKESLTLTIEWVVISGDKETSLAKYEKTFEVMAGSTENVTGDGKYLS